MTATASPTWPCIESDGYWSIYSMAGSILSTPASGAGRAGPRCPGTMTATASPTWPCIDMTAIGPSTRWRAAFSTTRLLGRAGLDPGAGDYDGDGKSDLAVYRMTAIGPST